MVTSFPSFRRMLTVTTALGMAFPAFTPSAFAQEAGTPPSRVGQISSLTGSVSFNGSGSGGWTQAADNYPVSAGDSLYTQGAAQAGIALDSSRIILSSETELQVTGLDDTNFAATLSQGEVAFAISYLQPGQVYTISTPRGTVSISQNGQYDIIAGDANAPTMVNVFQGEATVAAPGASLQVTAGQAGVLSGGAQTVAQLGQAQQDSFTSTVLAENETPPPSYAPPVVNQMTGAAELNQYGSWQQSSQYGAVWYPSVASGWAPYRQGHWADIQPWGWTWVESEPWGFAPFHYGRWVDDDNRWGWAPAPAYDPGSYGPAYQPVYAPAVVSFFGAALAVGITAAVLSSGSVGWVPLAPGEPYYPTYHAPAAYIRQINYVNVRNISNVHITNNYYYGSNFSPNQLANRRAATFVSADVMSRGEHVAGYAHTPRQDELAAARPIDTGFGHANAQAASYRLPPATRSIEENRPGLAPRQTDFAQRRNAPPATLSHTPFNGHPVGETMAPHPMNNMEPAANRPNFATAPGYHAPPPPPGVGEHPGKLPPAENFHPASENHAAPQFAHPQDNAPYHPPTEQHPGAPDFHPAGQAYHPPAEAYHPPAEAYHPPAQAYHPPAPQHAPVETYHPAAQAYHPPAQQYHPPVQQYHPQQEQHPRPMQMAARPQQHAEPNHGGQHEDKHPN